MTGFVLSPSKALWVFGGLLLLLQAPLVSFEKTYFLKKEPFFKSPIRKQSLCLRNDSYGKGAFGASRNHGRTHEGIDILAPVGEPVIASKSGRVQLARGSGGYGNYVEIRHPDGLKTRYAHLSTMLINEGEWVRQSQIIGASGKTGNAKNRHIAPHLHFEIRSQSAALNPSRGLLDPAIALTSQ